MKYSLIEWPDIQYYMGREDFKKKTYFDPSANIWFIPEKWEEDIEIAWNEKDIGDLNDVIG